MSKDFFVFITVFILQIVMLIFAPVLTFVCGYLGGMILDWVVGNKIVAGMNLIFDTTSFSHDLIPLTCGTLAVIGSYFKTSVSAKSSKDKNSSI